MRNELSQLWWVVTAVVLMGMFGEGALPLILVEGIPLVGVRYNIGNGPCCGSSASSSR